MKVVLTDAAIEVVRTVRGERNGCCDSTAPFLFEDYLAGPTEHEVALIEGVKVFVDEAVARSFEGREVVIDAADDPQPDSFSCEAELGLRFVLDRLPAV